MQKFLLQNSILQHIMWKQTSTTFPFLVILNSLQEGNYGVSLACQDTFIWAFKL